MSTLWIKICKPPFVTCIFILQVLLNIGFTLDPPNIAEKIIATPSEVPIELAFNPEILLEVQQQNAQLLEDTFDPKKYMPMPFPQVSNLALQSFDPNPKVIAFDLQTRQEKELSFENEDVDDFENSLSLKSFQDSSHITPQNFSDLTRIENLANNNNYWPYVKLFMKFKQRSRGTTLRDYVCSGVLVDSLHVLTAGHCVYSHQDEENGWIFNGWAYSIKVVPAYENGHEPFGYSEGTDFFSFVPWTDNQDFRYDIGLIRLNRPIGVVVGWKGLMGIDFKEIEPGKFGVCTFVLFRPEIPGYPAENPYNGQYMYSTKGTFDSCGGDPDYIVRYNNRSYKGQSGSGATTLNEEGFGERVFGVLSHGNDTYTGVVPLYDDEYYQFAQIINEVTPPNKDLTVLGFKFPEQATIIIDKGKRGRPLFPRLQYAVHNLSNASHNGRVDAKMYLSTDPTIDPNQDVLIEDFYFDYLNSDFGPRYIQIVETPATSIPEDIVAGTYYIGLLLNINDHNNSNNLTTGQDLYKVNIIIHEASTPPPQPPKRVFVSSEGSGSGRITSISHSGIDCGVICAHTYEYNTLLSLKAVPDSDSRFVEWKFCKGDGVITPEPPSDDICIIYTYFDRAIVAVFEKQEKPFECSLTELANYPLGDANASGAVTSADALLILRMAFGVDSDISIHKFYHGDLNGDGQVTSGDVLLALRKYAIENRPSQPKVYPANLSLRKGETTCVLVGNAGNIPLSNMTLEAPNGINIVEASTNQTQGKVYHVTASNTAESGVIIFKVDEISSEVQLVIIDEGAVETLPLAP